MDIHYGFDLWEFSSTSPQNTFLKPFSVMNLKIRQYLSANTLLPAAKVFAQSVDITHNGFDRQL
jgi:hypothetical protein